MDEEQEQLNERQQEEMLKLARKKLESFHSVFKDNRTGVEVLEYLKEMYYYEHSNIHDSGKSHADLTFYLGQRSVIAEILRVLSTKVDDINGENKQRKAITDE